METYRSLSHSRYDCKYHVVFVPKRRKQALYGKIREYLKGVGSGGNAPDLGGGGGARFLRFIF